MNLQKLTFINTDIAQTPQDHLSIDLLGPYNIASQGNLYASTAVCNLSGYLMTIPIKDKKKQTIYFLTSCLNMVFLQYYIWTFV